MLKKDSVIACSDVRSISIAVEQLHLGNVIALPTDTVYGFACSANSPIAIQKLYKIKGRSKNKPLSICVASVRQLKQWGEASHLPNELLALLLPGPVTIILHRSPSLNNAYLNPGISKIGIRIPDYDFIQKVSDIFSFPMVLTSANKSNQKSTLAIGAFQHLWSDLAAVFDGGYLGPCENEQQCESTVVDLSCPGFYHIKRNGIAQRHIVGIIKSFGIIGNRTI